MRNSSWNTNSSKLLQNWDFFLRMKKHETCFSGWNEWSLDHRVTFHLEILPFGLLLYLEWKGCKVIFRVLRTWLFQGSNISPLAIQVITYIVSPQNFCFLYWNKISNRMLVSCDFPTSRVLLQVFVTSTSKDVSWSHGLLILLPGDAYNMGLSIFILSRASIMSAMRNSEIFGINGSCFPDIMNI